MQPPTCLVLVCLLTAIKSEIAAREQQVLFQFLDSATKWSRRGRPMHQTNQRTLAPKFDATCRVLKANFASFSLLYRRSAVASSKRRRRCPSMHRSLQGTHSVQNARRFFENCSLLKSSCARFLSQAFVVTQAFKASVHELIAILSTCT